MQNVVTYNIEFGKNLQKIYTWLNNFEEKFDIICLQEFPENEVKKFDQRYKTHFTKSISKKHGIFGELTAIKRNIDQIDVKYLDFGEDSLENILKTKLVERSAIINKIKINNLIFSIANVHLTPISLHGKRKKQLEMVINSIDSDSSIILGDFNYSSLLGNSGLLSFMKDYGYILSGEKTITNLYKNKIPQQLDYVFYKNMEISDSKTIPLPYSDHYPVVVKIS